MGEETVTSDELLGYAMDGFPIYGPLDDDSVLDACNGMLVDGNYQYHVRTFEQVDETLEYCNGDSPETNWNYILGCYAGSVDSTEVYDSTTYTLDSDCVLDSTTPSPTKVPTASPTKVPTASPVDVATASPTKVPTASPVDVTTASPTTSSSCLDSPLENTKYTTCEGVVDAGKCSKKKFWSHCRNSCDKCNKCVNSKQKLLLDAKITLYFTEDGETTTKKKKKPKCKQIKKADNYEDICDDSDIAASCPKLCGLCS